MTKIISQFAPINQLLPTRFQSAIMPVRNQTRFFMLVAP